MKHGRKIIVLLVVLSMLASGFLLSGCGSSGASEDESETITTRVTRGNLMTSISSYGTIIMPEQSQLSFGSGSSINDLSTILEVNVEFGDVVKEGDVLARLDTTSLERVVEQAEASLRTAEINLQQATSETNLVNAQAAVVNAEINLTKAERELEEARLYAESDAKATLETAKLNLTAAQKKAESDIANAEYAIYVEHERYMDSMTEYIWGKIPIEEFLQASNSWKEVQFNLEIVTANAADSIEEAERAVTSAEYDLANYQQAIQMKETSLARAQADLVKAEEDLAYIEAGHDVELLQIKVDNAQVTLDEALDQLKSTTLVAPFDGTIVAVYASAGDEVTPNDVILQIVNTSVVEVDAEVDEIDVSQVASGQRAVITVDALSNVIFMGNVTAVSPLANSQQGVVTYDIAVDILNYNQDTLREGMSVTIEIVNIQAENVLLVPSGAITRSGQNIIVEVVTATGETEERAVEVGETNGAQTEIISGVNEGEEVIVHASSSTTTGFGQFPGGGMMPGGGGVVVIPDGGGGRGGMRFQ